MTSGQWQAIAFAAFLALAGVLAWQIERTDVLSKNVAELESSVARMNAALAEFANSASSTTAANIAELARRSQVAQKSEDQELQNAVAVVTPAVVSIVESKEVPKLEVTYENPFGNDPFFQGFGVQVPVYRQVGTTTQKVAAGTGFLVRANGYLVTNKHVVADPSGTYTVLLANGAQKIGTVIWRSPDQDLAVVKIDGSGYSTVTLGNSSALKLGQSVFAVGNALGQYNNSVSVGIVSGLDRTITAADSNGSTETLQNVIQTDAAINPGNSGGPLADLSGAVVGVDVATVQGSQNIGFALPVSEVRQALSRLGI